MNHITQYTVNLSQQVYSIQTLKVLTIMQTFLDFVFLKWGEMLDVVNASKSSLWLPYPVLVYICYAL